MTPTHPTHLLFLDLETTDSDPMTGHAAILEIGAIITKWEPDLPVVARASMLVRPAGNASDHDLMWARMLPVVRQMHTDNGLWQEATTSEDAWATHEADDAITGWLAEHVGETQVPIAGSGVGHLDVPFVRAFLPRLSTRVTYWPLDIGHTRRLLDLAGRGDLVDLVNDVEAKPHRGLGDAELHVAEARRYLQLLAQIPKFEQQPA